MNTSATSASASAAPEAVSEEQLISRYVAELAQLSPNGRLELMARLAQTLKSAATAQKSILDFAGAWAAMPGTDEEIIADIRNARHFSRPEISLD